MVVYIKKDFVRGRFMSRKNFVLDTLSLPALVPPHSLRPSVYHLQSDVLSLSADNERLFSGHKLLGRRVCYCQEGGQAMPGALRQI